jgi:hypothetical protein
VQRRRRTAKRLRAPRGASLFAANHANATITGIWRFREQHACEHRHHPTTALAIWGGAAPRSIATTVLLSVDETLEALRKAAGAKYGPPAALGRGSHRYSGANCR